MRALKVNSLTEGNSKIRKLVEQDTTNYKFTDTGIYVRPYIDTERFGSFLKPVMREALSHVMYSGTEGISSVDVRLYKENTDSTFQQLTYSIQVDTLSNHSTYMFYLKVEASELGFELELRSDEDGRVLLSQAFDLNQVSKTGRDTYLLIKKFLMEALTFSHSLSSL